jgi:dTMP kinase
MKLIVFEGIDNCGKSTSATATNKYFNKHTKYKTILVQESKDKFFDTFRKLKTIKFHHVFELWSVRIKVLKNIDSSADIAFVDRYYDSTTVYQSNFLKIPEMYTINYSPKIFKKPELTLLLDVPIDVAISRRDNGDMFESAKRAVIESRRSKYLEIVEKQKIWRNFKVINTANLTKEQMIEQCINTVEKHLKETI